MKKVCLLLLALPLAVTAQAQDKEKRLSLEEVIVTATKRESNLQNTAIAVSAFTSDMLESLDINSPFDFEALVPSLTFQQTPNRVSIRGVGRFSNALGVSPGVAIYNDGIFTAEATAMSSRPMNTQRTEVLRGPQGTLYGRNTTGGAVNIITKRPSDEFQGDFRAKVGNYGTQEFGFVMSGPITDSVRYKLHAYDAKRDGLQDNEAGDDLRTVDNTYLEAQLEWDITEDLNLWLKYGTLESDYIPGAIPSEDAFDCLNFWNGLGRSVQFMECQEGRENVSVGDPYTVAYNTPGRIKLRNNNNVTARVTYDFETAQLKYLYGLIEYDWDSREDYDETPNDYQELLDIGQYQEQHTHELQLTSTWTDKSWNYLLGLYYLDDKNEQPYNINAPGYATLQTITDLAGTSWENPLGIFYYQKGVLDNESWAAYGELGFDLSDKWALTVGARYSEDDYNGGETQLRYYDLYREFGFVELPFAFDASVDQFAGDPTRYVDGIDATHEDEFDNVTGKVNLSYRPWDGHLFWGTVANGYKMGGVRLGSLEAEFLEADGGIVASGQFDQEDMIMYEMGWKAELLDNTLRTELVGFFYTYDDMQQLRNFKTNPPASINLDEVINVDTEMYGVEATTTYLVTDNLRAIASYSYNHTEITSDAFFENWEFGERDENNRVIPENVKGSQLALTPEHKGALSLHYLWPTSVGEFTLGGTFAYVGKRYFDLGNHVSEGSYTRLDMQASWTSENGRYRIMGVVNNATDEDMNNTRSCTANDDGVYGTPSFIVRCSGNPMDQRIYTAEFRVRL